MTALVMNGNIVVQGGIHTAGSETVRNGEEDQHPIAWRDGESEQGERGQGHRHRGDLARTESEGHTVRHQGGDYGARRNDHGYAARP